MGPPPRQGPGPLCRRGEGRLAALVEGQDQRVTRLFEVDDALPARLLGAETLLHRFCAAARDHALFSDDPELPPDLLCLGEEFLHVFTQLARAAAMGEEILAGVSGFSAWRQGLLNIEKRFQERFPCFEGVADSLLRLAEREYGAPFWWLQGGMTKEGLLPPALSDEEVEKLFRGMGPALPGPCPDSGQVVSYALGECFPEEGRAVSRHLVQCPSCIRLVIDVQGAVKDAEEAPGEAPGLSPGLLAALAMPVGYPGYEDFVEDCRRIAPSLSIPWMGRVADIPAGLLTAHWPAATPQYMAEADTLPAEGLVVDLDQGRIRDLMPVSALIRREKREGAFLIIKGVGPSCRKRFLKEGDTGMDRYSRADLLTPARREIASDLAGRRWTMTVALSYGSFGFLSHPAFAENVFFHKSAFNNGEPLGQGDTVEVEVAITVHPKDGGPSFSVEHGVILERVSPPRESNIPANSATHRSGLLPGTDPFGETPCAFRDRPNTCWDAWSRIVPRLIQSAATGKRHPGLPAVKDFYRAKGWDSGAIVEWIPDHGDGEILRNLVAIVGRLNGMNRASQADQLAGWQKFHSICEKLSEHKKDIRSLAEDFLRPRLRICPGTGGGTRAVPPPKNSSRSRAAPSCPRTGFTGKAVNPHAQALPPPAIFPGFRISGNVMSIYIDEVEVGRPHGAIGGVVWDGPGPNQAVLPQIATHQKSDKNLKWLLRCSRAFPFVIPVSGEQTSAQYGELLSSAIQILLGWLIPSPPSRCNVRICLERYGQFAEGKDITEYVRGQIDETASRYPGRFGSWEIESVTFHAKEHAYIPWGDLMGYWYLEQVIREKPFTDVDIRSLPGYLPITRETLLRLKRLDGLEGIAAVSDILDLAADLWKTRLGEVLRRDLVLKGSRHADFQVGLLAELDLRYQRRDRNLSRLRRMFDAVRGVVGEPGPESPLRIRMLWTALALQDANHDGDPLRISRLTDSYEGLRQPALRTDRELLAHLDANLAVHLADRFELGAAQEVIERSVRDESFPYLSYYSQGRALSSLGQICAMQSQNLEADEHFESAVARFRGDPGLTPQAKALAVDQTDVYRAINALDGGAPEALGHLWAVLGEDLEAAARGLAASVENPYHHHLLLRACFMRNDLEAVRAVYLGALKQWQEGDQHPWMLIDLYRGILLWRAEREEGHGRFLKAIRGVQCLPHGATLDLIGGMIATVGWCLFEDPYLREQAGEFLRSVPPRLPAASGAVSVLEEILENPEEERVPEALGALPFNYH